MRVHADQMTTLEKKIGHFSRILSNKPGDELTVLALAEASFRRGLKLDALTAYQDVVGTRTVPEAHLAVAEIYSAQDMPNEAYGELRRLFELDPDNVEARLLVHTLQEIALAPEDISAIMQRPTSEEAFAEARLRLKIQRAIYNRELQERTRNVTLEPGVVIHEYHMEEAKKKLIRVDELLRELERFREFNQTLSLMPQPEPVSAQPEPDTYLAPNADAPQTSESPPVLDELPQEMTEQAALTSLEPVSVGPEPTPSEEAPGAEPVASAELEPAAVASPAPPAFESATAEPSFEPPAAPEPSFEPPAPEPSFEPAAMEPSFEPAAMEPSFEPTAPEPSAGVIPEPSFEAVTPEPSFEPAAPEPSAEVSPEPSFEPAAPEPSFEPPAPEPSAGVSPEPSFEAVTPEPSLEPLSYESASQEPLEPATPEPSLEPVATGPVSPEEQPTRQLTPPTPIADLPTQVLATSVLNSSESEPGHASGETQPAPRLDMDPLPIAAIEPPVSPAFQPEFEISMDNLVDPDLPDPGIDLPTDDDLPSVGDIPSVEIAESAPAPAVAPPTFDDAPAVPEPALASAGYAAIEMMDDSTMILTAPEPEPPAPVPPPPLEPAPAFSSGEIDAVPQGVSGGRKAFYETHAEALSSLTTTLARTRGVTSIFLVAREGETINSVVKDDITEKRVGDVVRESFEFLEAFASDPAYWVLECAGGIFVMQKLDDRHVLIAIGQAGANFGALRYTMDKTRTKFEQLLAQAPA